jgi:hypothetical protein
MERNKGRIVLAHLHFPFFIFHFSFAIRDFLICHTYRPGPNRNEKWQMKKGK